jgi:hypothetical protein
MSVGPDSLSQGFRNPDRLYKEFVHDKMTNKKKLCYVIPPFPSTHPFGMEL